MKYRSHRKQPISYLVTVFVTLLLCQHIASADAHTVAPESVKISYIPLLAKFVRWPVATKQKPALQLCIIADGSYTPYLQSLRNEQVGGQRFDIVHSSDLGDKPMCDIAFLSTSSNVTNAGFIDYFGNSPTLTIGDDESFCGAGGTVQLIQRGKRIIFGVNHVLAIERGLNFNSQLLKLVKDVKCEREPQP